MKILSAEQIRKADAFTIEHEPIKSINLMERASVACETWISTHFGTNLAIKVFAGPGNNGGDGLAIGRLLEDTWHNLEVFLINTPNKLSPDAYTNYLRLAKYKNIKITVLENEGPLPPLDDSCIVIDALFGSGLSRPLSGLAARVVNHINSSNAKVVAIDVPSGLFTEENISEPSASIIRADHTLTFQALKLSFLFAENQQYLGQWWILNIGVLPEAINMQASTYSLTELSDIIPLIPTRKKFSHKGSFGHGLLIAGSQGKMGAAVLSSRACMRTGIGLLTTHLPSKGYEILQIAIPEAMVSIDTTLEYPSTLPDLSKYTAIGIGPGIGTNDFTGLMLRQLLKTAKVPLVIDADALNLLALNPELMELLPENTILTPHPGEFDRLTGPSVSGYQRHLKQLELSKKYKINIVLKGSHTSITSSNGYCHFNSSGNPGMATAGSGDVLTGIILSLLAQGYHPLQASITGVYLHGLAGDIAEVQTGEESLIASDIIDYISKAFKTVKSTS
jgi:ADP-dependent NAD(P)H-hydrate dehydratase / NAD(P)H-hydrate epimerase